MAQWNVPAIAQRTLNLCWEACAQMMWQWHYRTNPGMRAQYAARAGRYARLNQGLTEAQMNTFYTQLGMRSLQNSRGANVLHALQWTPVIITSSDQVTGHAMLVAGNQGANYMIVNPCGIQAVDFASGVDSCTATTVQLPRGQVDAKLGSYIWYW
ncbi:MAG: hypothetical protein H6975_07600 [Gammaproteobacteria bacterium]|nr:hypothetical protein [Gammaproteobacteria bacterium]